MATPTGLQTPIALFGAAAAGCSYAPLNHRLPASRWLDLAARERVTHAFVVPTMLARIVAAIERLLASP